jgi:hypothetical protein
LSGGGEGNRWQNKWNKIRQKLIVVEADDGFPWAHCSIPFCIYLKLPVIKSKNNNGLVKTRKIVCSESREYLEMQPIYDVTVCQEGGSGRAHMALTFTKCLVSTCILLSAVYKGDTVPVRVSFSSLWQISKRNSLKGEGFILHQVPEVFPFMVGLLHCCGPVARLSVMEAGLWARGCSPHGNREAERTNRKGPGQDAPQTCPQWPISSSRASPPKVSSPSQSLFNFSTHEGIDPLIKSEPSGPNHFPKAHQLTTKPQYMSLWGTLHTWTITGLVGLID